MEDENGDWNRSSQWQNFRLWDQATSLWGVILGWYVFSLLFLFLYYKSLLSCSYQCANMKLGTHFSLLIGSNAADSWTQTKDVFVTALTSLHWQMLLHWQMSATLSGADVIALVILMSDMDYCTYWLACIIALTVTCVIGFPESCVLLHSQSPVLLGFLSHVDYCTHSRMCYWVSWVMCIIALTVTCVIGFPESCGSFAHRVTTSSHSAWRLKSIETLDLSVKEVLCWTVWSLYVIFVVLWSFHIEWNTPASGYLMLWRICFHFCHCWWANKNALWRSWWLTWHFCCIQMYAMLKTDGMCLSWDVSEAALYIMTAVAKDLSWWVTSQHLVCSLQDLWVEGLVRHNSVNSLNWRDVHVGLCHGR